MKNHHIKNWEAIFHKTHLYQEAKKLIIKINKKQNENKIVCDFCHQEITCSDSDFSEIKIYYIFNGKNVKELFDPNHNAVLHKDTCFRELHHIYKKSIRRSQ